MSNESIKALLGRFGYETLEDFKNDLAQLEANGEVENLNAIRFRFGYSSLEKLKEDLEFIKAQAQETGLNGFADKFGYNLPNLFVSDIEHIKTGSYTEINSPASVYPANPVLANSSVSTLKKLSYGVEKGSEYTLEFSVADGSSIVATGTPKSNVNVVVDGTNVKITANNKGVVKVHTVKNGYTCVTPYSIPVNIAASGRLNKDAWQVNFGPTGLLFTIPKQTSTVVYSSAVKVNIFNNGAWEEFDTSKTLKSDGKVLSMSGTTVNIEGNAVGEGYMEITIPEDQDHRETTVRFPVLLGQADGTSGTKDPVTRVTSATSKLTPDSPTGEIVCSAVSAGYVYSMDPHIADVTNATNSGGCPTGTVSITGYRNGIARFGVRSVSSQYRRIETMVTVECSGFKETTEAYPVLASKWLIVPVIGQSNAVGYDESLWDPKDYPRNGRIGQLGMHKHNLEVDYLTAVAENFQNTKGQNRTNLIPCEGTRGLHYDLAKSLLPMIPTGYGIMIVPCAMGSSGLTTGNVGTYDAATMKPDNSAIWTNDGPLMSATIDRINYALNLNPDNRLFFGVFCLGENDGIAQLDSSTYKTKLQEFVNHINTNLSSAKMFNGRKFSFRTDVIGFKSCKYWVNRANCTYGSVVVPAQREFFGSNYVEFDDDVTFDTNATNGTGKMTSAKASHYGNDVYRRRIVPAIMDKVKNNYGNKIIIK